MLLHQCIARSASLERLDTSSFLPGAEQVMNSANTMQPTETDSLLPTSSTASRDGRTPPNRKSWRLLFCGISAAGVIGFSCNRPLGHRGYQPNRQINQLNALTQTSLDALLDVPKLGRPNPTSHAQSRKRRHGKMNILTEQDVSPKVYHCTSTLIIMRHCDKGVTVKRHGREFKVDSEDSDGDRHCNAKGKARSEYIASLFVDPLKYQKLVQNLGLSRTTIPPVPMVASSLQRDRSVGNRPAKEKPQFPAPIKLYALNDSRHKHRNFREVETITPLADKFRLDVDERFGVYEEGDLAMDYFATLSESVLSNVQRLARRGNVTDDSSREAEYHTPDDSDVERLCHNGMTVVNWKHSRIPHLARALGCGRGEGCPKKYYSKDFDTLWMVTFQYSMRLNDDDVPLLGASSKFHRHFYGQHSLHGSVQNEGINGKWKINAQLINEGFDPVLL
ncbi:hypothetical protein HJC23_013316 [Cyclotella cryptica]|uniref:Uncharacterized protein n=1 Tax=Cyclotella cryptica TaxID=29204 RepID=A0ABD3Q1J5_9STRA|eukprot:CCRYP_009724-RA/>CCRYP_009724-RA protein AED:0.02 eAED:0.02 QI:317/1/1/1/1/1/2/1287/447